MSDYLKDETTDLITCCVCIMQYDEKQRKPKFLNCSHSACQQCLQMMYKNGVITCPLCRKKSTCSGGVASLASNNHALHMIKMQKSFSETLKKQQQQSRPSWCCVCGSLAKTSCFDSHTTVGIPLEKFTAGYELQKLVTSAKGKLEAIIQKRLECGTDLGLKLASLRAAEATIQSEILRNEDYLRKAMNSLDALNKRENCSGNFQAIKEKMEKSNLDSDKELRELEKSLAERKMERKIRIRILLEVEDKKIPTIPLLEDGFCQENVETSGNCTVSSNLVLISHLIISDLKRRNVALIINETESTSNFSGSA